MLDRADKRAPAFERRATPGAQVSSVGQESWRLEIPPGYTGRYRLAQLDDYGDLARRAFPWQPPFSLQLEGRASTATVPGTWGFGLWNDPFGMGMLGGGGLLRLPVFPDAAWFFFAGGPNHLALRDDLAGSGWLAQVFRSPSHPTTRLALCLPWLPFALLPAVGRLFRRLASRQVTQQAISLPVNPGEWHQYELHWRSESVDFCVDGRLVFQSGLSPRPPLGLVIWVDNQYAAWGPDGRLRWGRLANPEPAWLEIRGLSVSG